ncbi:hypothetical protein SAY86_000942 [Trapa natans]|uniref:Pulmonary surfactant-associated protein B n=1 Tax=Trapa natans TaxID=22666 RepID=A0AAN7MCT4_TRANT|nr:hypothetical protein SAY86_000942 [Trapa natans]
MKFGIELSMAARVLLVFGFSFCRTQHHLGPILAVSFLYFTILLVSYVYRRFLCVRYYLSIVLASARYLRSWEVGVMDMRICLLLLFTLSAAWSSHARQLSEQHQQEDVSRNENLCTLCEEYAVQALDYLNNNITQIEVLQLLHERCSRMPTFKQQCITLVDYYAPLFFLEVSSIQPSEFCQKVNLCEQITLLSAQNEDSCQLCHQAVFEVLDKLKDPDTQVRGIITFIFWGIFD